MWLKRRDLYFAFLRACSLSSLLSTKQKQAILKGNTVFRILTLSTGAQLSVHVTSLRAVLRAAFVKDTSDGPQDL